MLNIPNSIKTLFKTDGTRKNFRVQFPNNELPDITNDNIVRESVHFTESICSQSTFRFGLAEASVIEFETVGIGNMYGMTISCSYEIDTSSLSASEIASIQSDPGDGELVLASASDIGFGFYRVPLGVFRVERCPRNHGAMTHRQVTGYSVSTSTSQLSPFEMEKEALPSTNASYDVDVMAFLYSNIGYYSPEALDAYYTKTEIFNSSTATPSSGSQNHTETVGGDTFVATLTYTQVGLSRSNNILMSGIKRNIYGAELGGIDVSGLHQFLMDFDAVNGTKFSYTAQFPHRPYVEMMTRYRTGGAGFGTVYLLNDTPAFYPYIKPVSDLPIHVGFDWTFYTQMSVQITKNGTQVAEFSTATTSPAKVYEYTPNQGVPEISLSFAPTGTTDTPWSGLNTFTGAVDISTLLSGFFEVSGKFGKSDRLGGIEDFALSPSSPISISPGDYDEVWWDEYDVSPIGTVTVTYRNGEEGEATANVTLGAGASLYDMTDNEVLKNLSTADLDSITTLLSGDFATNAQNVGFTPVELTMQGWPWLEAGDALQITAEDGTVVNTYALRVEMSGIQHLMSDITAEGGEIIGEV